MTTSHAPDPDAEWDCEVMLSVQVQMKVKPGPGFEGWQGRTPAQLAADAVHRGGGDPSRWDGWADLEGDVDVTGAWQE